jgi:catalase
VTLETAPSVLWDAVAFPGGHEAMEKLQAVGHAVEFLKDSYRHCKPILVMGDGTTLLEGAGASTHLPSGDPDPGVLGFGDGEAPAALREFTAAIARHRHFAREIDPPLV